MQALRHAKRITRFVLVWFAMALGVAMASPLIQPQSLQMVCSASGAMKLVISDDDGAPTTQLHLLDCSLCLAVAPPPPQQHFLIEPHQPLAVALGRMPAARLAARTGAPLPPRGPPLTA